MCLQEDTAVQPMALDLAPLSPYLKPKPLPELPQVALTSPHTWSAGSASTKQLGFVCVGITCDVVWCRYIMLIYVKI